MQRQTIEQRLVKLELTKQKLVLKQQDLSKYTGLTGQFP